MTQEKWIRVNIETIGKFLVCTAYHNGLIKTV